MASKWDTVELGTVATVKSGYAFKSRDWTDAGVPVVKIANVKSGRLDMDGCSFITEPLAASVPEAELKPKDILIAMTGYIGDTALVSHDDLPAMLNQRVGRFGIKDHAQLDWRYFFFVLRSDDVRSAIEGLGYGSAQPNVSPKLIQSVQIPLPPLPVQQRIADVLGKLDDKIELNRRMNRTLEKMAAAIFKSWFIDFDPVHAKAEGRDPNLPAEIADLFPDTFEDSDLGLIPAGWTVAPMEDLADVNARSIRKDYLHARIRYVDISSVSEGSLNQTTAYDLADAPSRAKRLVQTGDSIWSCVRPNRKAYLYIDRPADNLVVSTGFAVLSPRAVPASYLHQWVTTQVFVDYLTAYATGAAYPAVKADTFKAAKMLLPTEAVLEAFQDLVGRLRARIAHNQRQNRRLAGLRDTLLPKLLSGEIELPEAEAIAEEVT